MVPSDPRRNRLDLGRVWGLLPENVEEIERSVREGVCWSATTEEMDVNLVAWSPSHGVAAHVNDAVDVLIVGVQGRGVVEVDEGPQRLTPGRILVVSRGARRSIRAESRLLYLTCHRHRPGTFTAGELFGAPEPRS